jgi:hypothetical protein
MSKAINTIQNAISSLAYPMPTVETVVGELEGRIKKLERELNWLLSYHNSTVDTKGLQPLSLKCIDEETLSSTL